MQLLPELATDSNFNAFNFAATAPGARQNQIIAEKAEFKAAFLDGFMEIVYVHCTFIRFRGCIYLILSGQAI